MFKSHGVSRKPHGAISKQTSHALPLKRLATVLSVLVIVVVMAASVWQLRDYEPATWLPIEYVAFEGRFEHLEESSLQQQVVQVLEGGYFSVDLDVIRNALLQLPWVEDISVRRQWPATLSIRVDEKQAVAYWGDTRLLSARGELFTPDVIEPALNLPALNGPESQHAKVWEFFVDTQTRMNDIGLRVARVALDNRRAWHIYVSTATGNHVDINLGREFVTQRLQRFLQVFALSSAPSLSTAKLVDMRYPNGFAMRYDNKDKQSA